MIGNWLVIYLDRGDKGLSCLRLRRGFVKSIFELGWSLRGKVRWFFILSLVREVLMELFKNWYVFFEIGDIGVCVWFMFEKVKVVIKIFF